MKPKTIFPVPLCLAVLACAASADTRTSADYSISTESIDQGGATLSSANYTINASANDTGAAASEASSGYLSKGGYIGQLFDAVGVIPTAPASTVKEGLTLQLGAAQVLDDTTLLPLSPALVTWSVASGPIGGISNVGLATASPVYQDTAATVRAAYQGNIGTLSLTVLNVTSDDFDVYAGDGLPDAWQVQYFGQNNLNAAPDKDITGSGQTNLFKYIAGLDPTDKTAVFRVSVKAVSGQPSQKQIVFSPVLGDRTYVVLCKTSITDANWAPLTGATQSDDGQQRTVTDPNAGGATKFYKVQVSKP